MLKKTHKFCPKCGKPSENYLSPVTSFSTSQSKPIIQYKYTQEQSSSINLPKPKTRFYTPPQSPVNNEIDDTDEKPAMEQNKTWECKHCTFINAYERNICEMCSKTSWVHKPVSNDGQQKQEKAVQIGKTLDEKPVYNEQALAPEPAQRQQSDPSGGNVVGVRMLYFFCCLFFRSHLNIIMTFHRKRVLLQIPETSEKLWKTLRILHKWFRDIATIVPGY